MPSFPTHIGTLTDLLRLFDDLPRREVLRIRLELMIRACDAIQREIANLTASTVRPGEAAARARPTAGGPNPPQQQRPTPTQRGAGRLSTGW